MTVVTPPPALLAGEMLELLERSRAALTDACGASTTTQRHAQAQLAALRAAAALLAQVAPRTVGSRPRSAWEALSRHAPEFAEWSMFFASSGRRSRQAQAGIVTVGLREADDLVRQAEHFLDAVLVRLGLPARAPVAVRLAPAQVR